MPIQLRAATSAVLLTLLASASVPLIAQEQVTVLRRNGERVSGRFEAWNLGNDSVYIRVTPGDQRIIPMRDVAVIAVGGDAQNLPANEVQAAGTDDHVLVTTGGELLRGRLTNIEGGEGSGREDEPRIVTFRAGNERRFPMRDVARLYVGNFPQTAAPAPAPEPAEVPPGTVRVPGNQQWTAANFMVRDGDRIQFSGSGEIQLSVDPEDRASVAGSLKGRRAPGSPAPQYLAGALIGRIGGGAPFAIGDQTAALPMSGNGPLWLGVNDDQVGDNSGEFVVTVRLIRRGR